MDFSTGGTTFNGHLSKEMRFDEDFIILSNWGFKYQKTMKRPSFKNRSPEMLKRVKVLSGHHTYYGIHRLFTNREPRYLTFIRDPAERCVSFYNFRKSKRLIQCSFEEWYELDFNKNYCNGIVKFYCECLMQLKFSKITQNELNIAKKMLDLCWFVGITYKLDVQLNFIFSDIGVDTQFQNYHVSGNLDNQESELLLHPTRHYTLVKFETVNDEIRSMVYKDHPYDLELYQYGLEINTKYDHGINGYGI